MHGTLPRALGRALILTAGLALLAPPVAGAADELALIDKTERIGPGITLRHLKTVDETGWYDHQILTADLSNSAVKSDSLWTGAVAKGGPLSEAADEAGLPADPEFRAALMGYAEWGTRLAVHNSQPGAEVVEHAPEAGAGPEVHRGQPWFSGTAGATRRTW